ncbi:MAG: DUF2157 domain-containing protein, partial [Acidobacteria bacterium]|nr:DUF2157 domain-containing protein [Acidobacteriota bacterium]
SNWGMIPRWGKLSIIFLSLFSSYSLGYYLRYEKKSYPKVGGALIFLGCMIYGAGIFLIAQIYNISVHYPNGPLMWALGVLPLAYLLRFKTILFLALIDLIIWLPMELSFHITSYHSTMIYFTMFLFMGICYFSLGLMQSKYDFTKDLSRIYLVLGAFLVFGSFYVFTFEEAKNRIETGENLFPFLFGFSLIFAFCLLVNFFFAKKDKFIIAESALLLFLFIFAVWYLSTAQSESGKSRGDFFVIVTNIIYFLMIVGIIILGFKKKDKVYINIGLIFFVFDVFARYFDFFFKLLPRSIFFIAGGLMLIFGGIFLEKKRRKILKSFNVEEDKL